MMKIAWRIKILLKDGEIVQVGDIKIECILVPGHNEARCSLTERRMHRTSCEPCLVCKAQLQANGVEQGDADTHKEIFDSESLIAYT